MSGFSVKMYFNDHDPPHVHVFSGSREARIGLLPVVILSFPRMSWREAARAREIVYENREFLITKWFEFHG
jgi:hypothetical protein